MQGEVTKKDKLQTPRKDGYDFSKLEKLTKNQLTQLRKYLVANYDRFLKSNDQRINFDYLFCTACEEIECEDLVNEIFICDMCSTQVHQKCYGGDLLDFTDKTNNWFCERCLLLMEEYRKQSKGQIQIVCKLCPETNQMLRNVTVLDQTRNEEKFWVHLSCLRRVPTIQTVNPNMNIFNVEKLSLLETKNKHSCRYCKQNYGLLQECSYTGCDKYYHIGCAKSRGLIIHQQGMQMVCQLLKEKSRTANERNIYCIEHIRAHINALTVQIGQEQADEVINQTIVVMEYRWEKWYQWNFSKADRYRQKQKAKIPLPPQESIVLQTTKPRQTQNSRKTQSSNTPIDITPPPEMNNSQIEDLIDENQQQNENQDQNIQQMELDNEESNNEEQNLQKDQVFVEKVQKQKKKQTKKKKQQVQEEEVQINEDQNLNIPSIIPPQDDNNNENSKNILMELDDEDQAQNEEQIIEQEQEIKVQKPKKKKKNQSKKNRKKQKKYYQVEILNPFEYEQEEDQKNQEEIQQNIEQNHEVIEQVNEEEIQVQSQIYQKILDVQREVLNRKILELIEIYRESSPEQYYQLKEILQLTSVFQCLEMYQQVLKAQYLQNPDDISELQEQLQDISENQNSESKKPRTRHLQITPEEEQKLSKKPKKIYQKKKKPLVPIVETQNEDQKSQSNNEPDYKPQQEVEVENIARQLLNFQIRKRGRPKLDNSNQQNSDQPEITETQQSQQKKEKVIKAPKAKLIQAYQQNLTDEDIITQIENLSIKDNQLNTTIPKKFRTLRKIYEENLRKNLFSKLTKIRKEFVELNKNQDFFNQQIYGRIDIQVCKMLFNEYHDIYNIDAFDKYVWGYMFFSGLLDPNNKFLDLSSENSTCQFWRKRCDIMNLDHDCDVIEFIYELRQTYITMVSQINEEMKQKQQLDNLFQQAKETLLID